MTKQRSRLPTGIMIGRSSYTNDRAERIELAQRGERAAGMVHSIGQRVKTSRIRKKVPITLAGVK